MATKRIRDLTTGTPAAGGFLAVDPASGSTYKVPVDYFTPARSEVVDFNTTDWNTLTTPGVYIVSYSGGSGGANRPPATYPYGLLLVLKSASLAPGLTQIYIPHANSDPGIYIRQSWEGTANGWEGWKAIGTYYGSNSNGSYIRFADGTQIAQHTIPSSSFGSQSGVGTFADPYQRSATWTYPAAFSATPVVQVTVESTAPGIMVARTTARSSTNANIRVEYAANNAGFTVNLLAIGRWY